MPLGIDTQASLAAKIARWRTKGLRIGWSNGCFDLLHLGHLSTLTFAKAQCDRLIVGVDDDASVTALKGPGRPINKAEARARLVAALRPVDAVVVFSAAMLAPLIAGIRPDILCKGADYSSTQIVGANQARHVILAPMIENTSSTAMAERLKACELSSAGEPASVAPISSPRSKGAGSAKSR